MRKEDLSPKENSYVEEWAWPKNDIFSKNLKNLDETKLSI